MISFLKNNTIRIYLALMVMFIPIIILVGIIVYNMFSSISVQSFYVIVVLFIVFDVVFMSWRISVVNQSLTNSNVVEEVPPSPEELEFQNMQIRMKGMNQEGEFVVENEDQRTLGSTEKELRQKEKNSAFNDEHRRELYEAEVEKTNSDAQKKLSEKNNVNEMFDWLEKNPTKCIADWKFMKAEEEKAAEEARIKKMAEERANLVADASGQITPSDIKRVKDALVNHWIKQIEDGEVVVVPTDETLQGMGAKDWEPRNDREEKPKQQHSKKTNGNSPIKDFTA